MLPLLGGPARGGLGHGEVFPHDRAVAFSVQEQEERANLAVRRSNREISPAFRDARIKRHYVGEFVPERGGN